MSALYKRGPADVRANLTPMIDVTFLLIVFFVLVSQIEQTETVRMNLPTPHDPATMLPGDEPRLVINVEPGEEGRALAYRAGGQRFAIGDEGIATLTAHLASLYRSTPTLNVNLRADRATHYVHVQPVLNAVRAAAREAGLTEQPPRVNLVVVRSR